MSKHTKGPWVAKNATLPNSIVIRWVVLETQNGFVLADTGSADTPKSQDEANARLIAAAPELLETLKIVWHNGFNEPNRALITRIENIIAKAEGEEK